jgi:hypothetical protein
MVTPKALVSLVASCVLRNTRTWRLSRGEFNANGTEKINRIISSASVQWWSEEKEKEK